MTEGVTFKRLTDHPQAPEDSALELRLSVAANKSAPMVRFYAARLLFELKLGRTLTPKEADRLEATARSLFPRGTRKAGV